MGTFYNIINWNTNILLIKLDYISFLIIITINSTCVYNNVHNYSNYSDCSNYNGNYNYDNYSYNY